MYVYVCVRVRACVYACVFVCVFVFVCVCMCVCGGGVTGKFYRVPGRARGPTVDARAEGSSKANSL